MGESVTLQSYLEALLSALEKRIDQRFEGNSVALALGKEAIDARLLLLNELRGIMSDRLSDIVTKTEYNKLAEEVQELRRTQANRDGRMWVVSGSMSTIAVLAMWIISHWKQ